MKTLPTVFPSVLKHDGVLLIMAVIVTCLSCKTLVANLRWIDALLFFYFNLESFTIYYLYYGNINITFGMFPVSVLRKLQYFIDDPVVDIVVKI